ncbi:MAG: CsbD family protein [Actinomycetota bacterium]|nr:CsbD family protein [Actinomycetota bacterium]
MANKDELKGRAKEAAGDLTDDEDLKREGKVDKTKGRAKETIDEVGDKVKRFVTKD